MWGGNQMLDEWFQGEFVFERSGVRVSSGPVESQLPENCLKWEGGTQEGSTLDDGDRDCFVAVA